MSTVIFTIEALVISLGSGALGAILGLGEGVCMVPLLVFLLNKPIHIAAGAGVIAVVATSSAAAAIYVKKDITNLRLARASIQVQPRTQAVEQPNYRSKYTFLDHEIFTLS